MVIVTGGAGFIGSAVVWKLNQMGVDRILVVDNLKRSEKWRNLVNRRYWDYVHKSALPGLLDSNALGRIEAIVHMGACSSTTETDADFLMENNFHYSRELARYALARGLRFINASSAATYGDGAEGFSDDHRGLDRLKPLNMYGYSKHLFDCWASRESVLDRLVSLKFFNVFGPNEYHKGDMCSVIFKAFAQVREAGRIRLFKSYRPEVADGAQRRDFVYVKDCAELVWWFLQCPSVSGVFNVGTGRSRSWNALARSVFLAMHQPPAIDYVDMPPDLRPRYQYFTQADMRKLSALDCPVRFTELETAVGDYIGGYLQQSAFL
jgi:ADP-L-glycero-D-manno-heptose 6-epimerase